jgi:FkbM family methyltransferase
MQNYSDIAAMNIVKTITQALLRPFGVRFTWAYTLERAQEMEEQEKLRRLAWIKSLEISTVLDVGANTGQFACFIRKLLPDAHIISFEPLSDCFAELQKTFAGAHKFQAFNLALGDQTGEMEVFRNEYTPSSSLLPMNDLHKENFPFAQKEHAEKIKIAKLDDLALAIKGNFLVKLDVQGFEDKVICGGKKTIEQATVIIVEMSTSCLYENQPLFGEIYEMLTGMGFQYYGNFDQLLSPINGRVLQMDGIFLRPGCIEAVAV